ncbi:hypothetical protein [Tenacibaculum sp. SG-28]|uniref:hypothetical protein n=1 Tax=Tenacibaculum sp. SG-28 TaxID=754426 RepID=UPI000CF52681|nr:hypothetical protein [Tenacibaculum sp. SG-28]PQJ21545.1 hypothetical protein BSU00_05360 [Tenacibaculum sp. SG-28]
MNYLKKYKWLWIITASVLVAGFLIINQILRPPSTVKESTPSYKGTSQKVKDKLVLDPYFWNNKTILIEGKITAILKEGIIVDGFVFCQLDKNTVTVKKVNDKIKIKGFVVGYDDLLQELKLNQCIFI